MTRLDANRLLSFAIVAGLSVAACSDGAPSDAAANQDISAASDTPTSDAVDATQAGDATDADDDTDQTDAGDATDVVDTPLRPGWPQCPGEPSTAELLYEKAASFDEIARRLHIHPELRFVATANLPTHEVPCEDDEGATCTELSIGLDEATWEDVERFETDANDGLWNALYMVSQAYRYAATSSPEALDILRTLMAGVRQRTEITGVPGLYARRLLSPHIASAQCPEEDRSYRSSPGKDSNRWVRIGDDGCIRTVDPESGEWVVSTACGLDDHAGWCWYDNVSRDEYSGHVYALGAILRLVDDEALKAEARELLEEIGRHLMDNELLFIDWDGRPTQHGAIFGPEMILAFGATAAFGSEDPDLIRWHDDCLELNDGANDCIGDLPPSFLPMSDNFGLVPLFLGDGCPSNWNNISMALAAYQNIAWFEPNQGAVERALTEVDEALFRIDHPRALMHQNNPWYTFMWASMLGVAPDNPDAADAVSAAMCTLRRFPASRVQVELDTPALVDTVCMSRLDNPFSAEPQPPELRCPTKSLWWFPPYKLDTCDGDPGRVWHPSDYLLAYWMGRYHGFIDATE